VKKLILLMAIVTILAMYFVTLTEAADMTKYIILYKTQAVSANAVGTITKAGGTLVYSYNDIGVVIARSSNASFRSNMLKDKTVQEVASTTGFAVKLDVESTSGNVEDPFIDLNSPAPGNDPLSGLQWDMVQIHSPEARAVEGGSSSIVVGVINSGVDFTHPDLAANIDFADSVSCVGGVPNQNPAAWMDDFGLGTHNAGIIAAAKNGIGIVGVAPNVKIAAIKASNASGFIFPEAVVCSFMWAGSHSIAVTDNSYFADPWLFNCRNDSTQRAIWEAERRAIRYAIQKGTVVVAAEGVFADDLAHPTQDVTSPDDTTPVTRTIHNDCAVIPVEIPGVIGVTANGNLQLKSYYSNYGVGVTQVIAPGGDSILQRTASAPNGRVLSTWPASLLNITCPPGLRVIASGTYCYLEGISAAPHVAGVAALIMSEGVTSPNAVASIITGTADPIACPTDLSIYDPFPSVNNGAPQVCQGGKGYNSFNGRGQVNALSAVTFPH
jgi:hypothetical protein